MKNKKQHSGLINAKYEIIVKIKNEFVDDEGKLHCTFKKEKRIYPTSDKLYYSSNSYKDVINSFNINEIEYFTLKVNN